MLPKFKKGFSLIELLVVIAIIGILAAVGITAYSGYTKSAKEKASSAQHAQVVALLNAEFSKCASGSGDFIWGTEQACNAVVDEADIVTHLNDVLGLKNPYNTGVGAAAALGADIAQATEGAIGIFCNIGATGTCKVRTDTGTGAESVDDIPRY